MRSVIASACAGYLCGDREQGVAIARQGDTVTRSRVYVQGKSLHTRTMSSPALVGREKTVNLPDDVEICKLYCLKRGKLEVVYQMSTGEYYCTGCGGRVPGERYVMKLRCDCEL